MDESPAIRNLRDYVALPSVNPMGRSEIPDEVAGEHRYAAHLREQLRGLGLDAETIGQGTRTSVVAEAVARGASDTVLVASHLDTVPVDGMTIDPFDPVVEGGRLRGRGSCDTKGGMAALVAALEHVLARGTLRRNVIVVGEADEELGSRGVHDVLAHLAGRPRRHSHPHPYWVLATEPTGLRVVTRHKGIALARVVASGRACHSSEPERGRNAIVALARAVIALDELSSELAGRADARLGPGTMSAGVVGGGLAPNIVPDEAWLLVDRRMLPGEDAEGISREIRGALERAGIDGVRLASCTVEKPPLGTADDHACARTCGRLLQEAGLPGEPCAVAFATDAGVFAEHGIPCVVMGPGAIAQAHTADEFVETQQVDAMRDFFVRLLESRS